MIWSISIDGGVEIYLLSTKMRLVLNVKVKVSRS